MTSEFDRDDIMKGVDDLLAKRPVVSAFDSGSYETDSYSTEDVHKRSFIEFFVNEQVLPKVTTNVSPRLFAPELKNIFADSLLGAVANLRRTGHVFVADAVAKCRIDDVISFIPDESEKYQRKLAEYTPGSLEYQYADRRIQRLDIILHAAEDAQKL